MTDRSHLVRFGVLGHVGRFVAEDATCYPRRTRVVLRTRRGLELGEVLSPPGGTASHDGPDGSILRGMTDADHLLETRLEKNRQEAYAACVSLLAERGVHAPLVDVEHLFDGQGLYFYFLGEVTRDMEDCTAELAELYATEVQFHRFAETLAEGCGPDCGTENGGGRCDTCNGCSVASACGAREA